MMPSNEMAQGALNAFLLCVGKIVDTILFICGFKVFPFMWHVRLWYCYFFRCRFNKSPIPETTSYNIVLFQPTVWTSGTPLAEIDLMGHKSNATYLSDLDCARIYHISSVLRAGMRQRTGTGLSFVNPQNRDGIKGEPFYPILSSVTCTFLKSISPGQKYDIVTRILSWDSKWLYLISHFVKKDAFQPTHYSDETRRKPNDQERTIVNHNAKRPKENIFAMSLARIVFKQGRKTVSPEHFLRDSELLPSVFEHDSSNGEDSVSKESSSSQQSYIARIIEERRLRGLEIAKHVDGLDDGIPVFDVHEQVAFSKF